MVPNKKTTSSDACFFAYKFGFMTGQKTDQSPPRFNILPALSLSRAASQRRIRNSMTVRHSGTSPFTPKKGCLKVGQLLNNLGSRIRPPCFVKAVNGDVIPRKQQILYQSNKNTGWIRSEFKL